MVAPRVEIAPRGAPDHAAGAVLASKLDLQDPGADRAVLQRGGVVVEPDELRKGLPDLAQKHGNRLGSAGREIDRDAAGSDRVHHQPMAERGFGGAQDPFAQDSGVGVHQGEGRVVADRADVAEMVGDPLEFGHESAQPWRARRRLDPERRLDCAGESDAIGDRRVAR